ncbi:DUF4091 domain-containing protein [Enterococcus faecalis]
MKVFITDETYKASTELFTILPQSRQHFTACRNSTAAFQLLLYTGKRSHFTLDTQFSIPDDIDTPIYRIAIESDLPVNASFVEYYTGARDLAYADKLIETRSYTYAGDRFAPIFIELPIDTVCPVGDYPVEITIYQAGITTEEQPIYQETVSVTVDEFTFVSKVATAFNLDIWQQPSNLARTFQVPLWSSEHFELIKEMAQSLAVLGQKAITVIVGEIPWKGWFNYIVKDYPANLYEYSMVRVFKSKQGQIHCDFSILERYLKCFFEAGIDQEIDIFGLLGVWQPPFFPLNKAVEHPEKLVIRYQDETTKTMNFLTAKADLHSYLQQVFVYFKEKGLWEKVRILADEPKAHEIEQFQKAVKILKAIEPTLQLKVALDKEPVREALLTDIDYPVTSYYCTCKNYQQLNQHYPGKTQYYICNYPDKPNTFLHSSLTESRVQGLLAYYFKTNGMLRWAYNCWPVNVREDIRYNTASLPIGDMCLIYPSTSGHLLLSLRYKQLYRGIEDFYLLKQATKTDALAVDRLVVEFLGERDSKKWMLDSHQACSELFCQEYQNYELLRKKLIEIIDKKK